jgi:hypothetical protein
MGGNGYGDGQRRPWEGESFCTDRTRSGARCGNREILGLEKCFWHVPEDMLEEAEQITGMRRCRQEEGCRQIATDGTDPPACHNHGANRGSETSKNAAIRSVDNRTMEHFEQLMGTGVAAEKLLNPPAIGDPFRELLALASEVKALKDWLREIVTAMTPQKWRYSGKTGEQYRAEIVLYERATERLAALLVNIVKLKIEDRLAGVEERTMAMIERALDLSLQASGASMEGQAKALSVLRRELKVLDTAPLN